MSKILFHPIFQSLQPLYYRNSRSFQLRRLFFSLQSFLGYPLSLTVKLDPQLGMRTRHVIVEGPELGIRFVTILALERSFSGVHAVMSHKLRLLSK